MEYEKTDFSLLEESALFDLDLDPVELEEWNESKVKISDIKKEQEYFRKMREKWPKIKEALNLWGEKFSKGDGGQRAIAAEHIFEIFTSATLPYSQMDEDSTVCRNAVATLRVNFVGEVDHPIRFLSTLCPEEVFMEAVCKTLGWAISKEKDGQVHLLSGAYDHTKGASYVTWFSNVLKWTSSSRRRKLNREFRQTLSIKDDTKALLLADQAQHTLQNQIVVKSAPRQQTRFLENLARLTADAMLADKMIPLKNSRTGEKKHIKAPTLRLFYSLQLVNFSRMATDPVSAQTDKLLLGTAENGFLTFSTKMCLPGSYLALVQADFSDYVEENKLYDLQDGYPQLQQQAVAHYRGKGVSTISEQFTTIKQYLLENKAKLT